MQQRKEKKTESKLKENHLPPQPPRFDEGEKVTLTNNGREEGRNGGLDEKRDEVTDIRHGDEAGREMVVLEGIPVPKYCLNKQTHNCDGLLCRLSIIHVTEIKQITQILKLSDYGRIGHPLWKIISYTNWPKSGIKFPGKFILSQLKELCWDVSD